uniref:Coatomer subunit delta n=1 Tax=Phallusia mammillata TaxID=59560 RepID=A0A6F9D754_9ASCI|nr:coatomer subunit delta-like [Phallusia mammillata]
MTRSRIEGLLAAFPKLMNTGKQHTFVETESVRYVYQPLEKMYMVLITTKNSNILEDLETLRLFSRVIPEYCRVIDETDIQDHAFELIFAFDEVVALGYRESVNLAQIRTFTEMDSHEEKVFKAVRKSQEDETKATMRRKAKELQQMRRDAMRGNVRMGGSSRGFGAGMDGMKSDLPTQTLAPEPAKKKSIPTRSHGKAMKLGAKSKDVDSFVDKLISEGEQVRSGNMKSKKSDVAKTSVPTALTESVHIRVEEKLSVTAGRDGGLQNMLLGGMCLLRISDGQFGCIRMKVENNDNRGCQVQTHPNVDKKIFQAKGIVGLKSPDKPFPLKQDVGVLKWRLQTTDESLLPLTINCWPNENADGGCDVNIEYELQLEELELIDVTISIPVPSGVGAPNVADVDGDFKHDSRKNILEWSLPVIDANNSSGVMEFSIAGSPDDFFPINVSFHATKRSYTDLQVVDVEMAGDGSPVKYSTETALLVEKYEIV